MAKIGVIGAGSWGTALSRLLANNGHDVIVWSIIEAEVKMLQEKHEHVDKLPGVSVFRVTDNFVRRSFFQNFSVVHYQYPVAKLLHQGDIMADEKNGEIFALLGAQLVQQLYDFLLYRHIQRRGSLITD